MLKKCHLADVRKVLYPPPPCPQVSAFDHTPSPVSADVLYGRPLTPFPHCHTPLHSLAYLTPLHSLAYLTIFALTGILLCHRWNLPFPSLVHSSVLVLLPA